MDRSELETALTSPRYLAGQLSQDEAAAFEEAYARDPEIVADLERVLRLKEGLAILRERGELTALLSVPPRRQWFARAAAAALVAVVIGSAFWQRARILHFVWRAPAMSADNRQSAQVFGSYLLVRTRESSAALEVPLEPRSGLIELRILPAQFIPHLRYVVRLVHREVSGSETIGEVKSVTPGDDHFVTIYVDKGRLARGDYDVFLALESKGPAAETDQFALRVR